MVQEHFNGGSNTGRQKSETVLFGQKKIHPEEGDSLRITNTEATAEIPPVNDCL